MRNPIVVLPLTLAFLACQGATGPVYEKNSHVTVLSGVSGWALQSIQLDGFWIDGLMCPPPCDMVYVMTGNPTLTGISTDNMTVAGTYDLGVYSYSCSFCHDDLGDHIYMIGEEDLFVVDLPEVVISDTITISTGGSPSYFDGICHRPSTDTVFVSSVESSTLLVVDIGEGVVVDSLDIACYGPIVSPDGEYLILRYEGGGICCTDAETGEVLSYADPELVSGGCFGPDSDVFYASWAQGSWPGPFDGGIYRLSIPDLAVVDSIHVGQGVGSMCWVPGQEKLCVELFTSFSEDFQIAFYDYPQLLTVVPVEREVRGLCATANGMWVFAGIYWDMEPGKQDGR